MDLSTFLERSSVTPFWTQLGPEERIVLVTDWMACLASGLSALHKKKIKHQDLKPENVLLYSRMSPVICDFGLSKAFDTESKSLKGQGTTAYLPPEQETGKVGRKGDIFSLGLIFLELGLLLFGQNALKHEIKTGPYHLVITKSLDEILILKFPLQGRPQSDDWLTRFRKLLQDMLQVSPQNRPKATEVWEWFSVLEQRHIVNKFLLWIRSLVRWKMTRMIPRCKSGTPYFKCSRNEYGKLEFLMSILFGLVSSMKSVTCYFLNTLQYNVLKEDPQT
jgi:serine/threonine protein kinase